VLPFRKFPGPLVAGVLSVLVSGEAAAFGNQWHAGAKAGFATQSDKDIGPAVGIHGAYGLSDMFDAEIEVLGSRNGGVAGTSQLFSATAGVAYKIDVLRWIPYVGLLGGYYDYMQAPGPHGESGGEFGMALQVGLDFLVTRDVALSLDFRPHFSFHDGVDNIYSPFQTLMLGAEYRWGF